MIMKKDKINLAICDDEIEILKEIERKVRRFADKNAFDFNISTFTEPEKLVDELEKEEVEICLLDIDMPRISGMDIAGMINDRKLSVLLIFVTGQDSLVYESFRYHPFSFIRKSMLENELEETLYSAVKKILEKENLILHKNAEQIRIELQNILYIEADGNYVKIVTEDECVRYRSTMSRMEEKLAGRGFIRIHKGFLVNEAAVYRIGKEKLALTNKTELPIGKNNRGQVREYLIKSFRNG